MLPEFFAFQCPTRLIYGAGIVERLGDEVRRFGPRRALLVTDRVIGGLGIPARLQGGLGPHIQVAATWDDVPPNSDLKTVEACAEAGRSAGCDMVVALGGGSVIDTAKVANLLLVKGGRVADHMGARLLDHRLHPFLVVPTTAGTGSEVTNVAVIADPARDVKLPFVEDPFLPDLAVLDPTVTVSMPPKVTAATGMDALTHAVEAYVDSEWSPMTDALALHAVRMVFQHLLRAVAFPQDLEARGGMLVAAALAGLAFTHSMVGVVHGVAHALGGVYGLPHGVANGVILPFGMEHNLSARQARFADLAVAMGASNLVPAPVRAREAVLRVRLLLARLAWLADFPRNLEEAGVTDGLARMDTVVDHAMADGSMLYNPAPVEAGDVRGILERAHRARVIPVPVSRSRLKAAAVAGPRKEASNVFQSSDELYDILGGFFLRIEEEPQIQKALLSSRLRIRFHYTRPEATITVDCTGERVRVDLGDSDVVPEVEMTMTADFAHAFWHGDVNLVRALARREVKARGEVPKSVKLLPILKPAYALYPSYLESRGLKHLILK